MNSKQKIMGEYNQVIFTIYNISISSNLYAFVYLSQDTYYTEQRTTGTVVVLIVWYLDFQLTCAINGHHN